MHLAQNVGGRMVDQVVVGAFTEALGRLGAMCSMTQQQMLVLFCCCKLFARGLLD